MNLFELSGILLGITSLILILIIGLYGKTRLQRVWLLFNVAVAIWGFGSYLIGKASNPSAALTSWKLAHIGIIFIPVLFYHTMCIFCNVESARKKIIIFAYVQAFFFLSLVIFFTNLFMSKVTPIFDSLYYIRSAGLYYPLYFSIWLSLVILGHYELIKFYRKSFGIKKNQSLYFFIGMILGFSGGSTNFLPVFGLDIYPIGNFTIPIYSLISTYAILRHRLMDFNIVLKKSIAYSLSVALLTGLFLVLIFTMTKYFSEMTGSTSFTTITAVYTLIIAVLFTPLKNGLQLLIDKVFHKTAYDYHTVLKDISHKLAVTMGLQLTYGVITDTIFDTLKLKSAYLLSKEGDFFETAYSCLPNKETTDAEIPERDNKPLSKDAGFIKLSSKGDVLIQEELPISHDQYTADVVAEELKPYEGAAVVPIFVENDLSYLLVLGEKLSSDSFSSEDINLLTTIANQSSIALKNARLYHELEQRVQARTADLSKANESLHKEISVRKRVEEALHIAQKGLELRVQERTVELRNANAKLKTEVAERMKVEESVRSAADQWRTTFDSMKDAIIMIDVEDRVVRVNKAGASLFNNEYNEIINKPITGLLQSLGLDQEIKPLAAIKRTKQHEEDEMYIPRKNLWVLVTTDPVLHKNILIGTVCILTDITGRKKAEEDKKILESQLIQTQKMESIGRLAGGIAHDFNNLLSVIIGYSELTLMMLPEGSPLINRIQIVKNTGTKAAGLTRQLLAFSRKQILEMKNVNVGAVVKNMGEMLPRLIGEDVKIELKSSGKESNIKADELQIEQIILNLAVNGRDSMPDGGSLIVETGDVQLKRLNSVGSEKFVPGPYVMLSVTDTGQGMTREVKEKIFEPFFTTKEKGKGTGMGLATVYGIVMQHKGYIAVDSAPGKGTTFKVYFPVVDSAGGESEAATNDRAIMPRGSETILVVDDEPTMCDLVTDTLVPLGYKILHTPHINEALRIGDTFGGVIDLLLTDVIMPDMNGKQLADKLVRKRPETTVVYMSGYTDDIIGTHGVLEPGMHFIQKPLDTSTLASKIRDILDSRNGNAVNREP